MAPIVTTGVSSVRKKRSHTSSLHWEPCKSALYRSTEILELCVSSWCQGHAYLHRKKNSNHVRRPCAKAMQVLQTNDYISRIVQMSFKPVTTFLELCVSSLCLGQRIGQEFQVF